MQNMTTECSNVINYNNSNNIYTLTIAWHFHKIGCEQTYRQTDILNYRTAIPAKDAKYRCKIQNITTEYSNNIDYNNSNNNHTLTTAQNIYKTRWGQTDWQADIVPYRAAIAAKNAKYGIEIF